ncbi:MAG: PqqD family protein [Proteobacteria bacterium]|nr:PqqD family protein [Pseudomonadota bacterium]
MSSNLYRRNPQTAGRIVDGLAFIVTPDNNKLHVLNATATCLWQLAAEGCTVERSADELTERYEVDRETALRDVETCLNDLVARQILIADS